MQFIALQASVSTEQVEIFARKSEGGNLELKPSTPVVKVESDPLKDLQIVGAQESLSSLCDSFTNCRGDLVRIQGHSNVTKLLITVSVFLLWQVF